VQNQIITDAGHTGEESHYFVNLFNVQNLYKTMTNGGTLTPSTLTATSLAPVTLEFLFHGIKEIICVQILTFFDTKMQQ